MCRKLICLFTFILVLALAGFAQAELLVNPDFEAGTPLTDTWVIWGGGSGSGAGGYFYTSNYHAAIIEDGTAQSGNNYIEASLPDEGYDGWWWNGMWVWQEHPVTEGYTYQLSGWVRDGDADGVPSLIPGGVSTSFEWRVIAPIGGSTGERGDEISRDIQPFDLTEEWTYVSATAVAPVGTQGISIGFTSVVGINFDIDNASFVELPIILVQNAGFEDPVLAEDDWTWLDISGWTWVGGEGPGVWNVTTADFDPVVAPEGQNVLYTENAVGDAGGVAQVLTNTFAANTDYTLTADVGNSWNYYWSGYSVQLLAGGIVIAEDNDTLWPDYMLWATSTVVYTYDPADSALVGQPLEIRLLNLGLDKDVANPGVVGVEFDNVTLSYVAVAAPNMLLENWEATVALASPGFLATNVENGTYDIGAFSGDMTYEFVVNSNPDEQEVSMALIGRLDFGDTRAGLKYEQWSNTGTYGATVFGVADHDYGVATKPGVDTHLVFVSSGGETALYVNGAYRASIGAEISLSGVVGIGRAIREDGTFVDNFDGSIFGVAIYDTALSADQIQAHSDAYFMPLPDATAPGNAIQGVPDDGDWPGGEPPAMVIDNDSGTKFLHYGGNFDPNEGPSGFRVTASASQSIVTGLTFTTANDSPERDPVAFELSGSNESIDGPYTLIASGDIVDFSDPNNEWPRFTKNETVISFDNDVEYAHYQVLFTAIRDAASANSMQIAEVELLAVILGNYDATPVDGDMVVLGTTLSWSPGKNAVSHDVYFGTSSPPAFVGNQAETGYDPGVLEPGITYYWQVDAVEADGTIQAGSIRSFMVRDFIAREAESADVLGANWRLVVDPAASGGVRIGSENGDGNDNDTAPGAEWVAIYNFDATGGDYNILLRAHKADSDSFWVRILGATSQTHEDPDQPGTGWVRFNGIDAPDGWGWDKVHSNDHSDEVVTWTLGAGAHTLEIAKREDGTYLDGFIITNDLALDQGTLSDVINPLTMAIIPSPADGADDVLIGSTLSWLPAVSAATHDVSFGTTSPPPFIGNEAATSFYPGLLQSGTTYYWQVDEVQADGTTTLGDVWSFTTGVSNFALDIRIATGDDDVEERLRPDRNGELDMGSSDLEFPYEDFPIDDLQRVGLRFVGVGIPQGAQIVSSYIEFEVDEIKDGGDSVVNVIIDGQLTPDAEPFVDNSMNVSQRPSWTSTTVPWSVPNWPDADVIWQTPDISVLVQEITDQADWAAGNAMVFTIQDDPANPSAGNRAAESYDGENDEAPLLHVEALVDVATQPSPANGAEGVPIAGTIISWWPGFGAVSHDGYIGTTSPPALLGNTPDISFDPGVLAPSTTYYWQANAVEADGTIRTGAIWSFTTEPGYATQPDPANYAVGVALDATLSWSPGITAATHDVYFGTSSPPALIGNQTEPNFDPGPLEMETTYYWQIDEVEADGTTVYTGEIWSFKTPRPGTGTILRAVWEGISGTSISDLTSSPDYPDNPTFSDEMTLFETPTDFADDFGSRLRGYLHPDTSGDYTFWIATDDNGELWLSTDESPANAVLISTVSAWAGSRNFDDGDVTPSGPISLVGGQKYYVEALYKEGGGGDNLAVAWEGPDSPTRAVIAGYFLSPYVEFKATSPDPANGLIEVSKTLTLSWLAGPTAVSHDVYFSADSAAVSDGTALIGNQPETSYTPAGLEKGGTYYWRVDEVEADGTTKHTGDVWSFTVTTLGR